MARDMLAHLIEVTSMYHPIQQRRAIERKARFQADLMGAKKGFQRIEKGMTAFVKRKPALSGLFMFTAALLLTGLFFGRRLRG
ncbi:MAG TPA: hypothetical protein VHC69_03655 [Polyangiaceae bacterium]|nr:hypothetical protein [Polyangiaceae bacterium]